MAGVAESQKREAHLDNAFMLLESSDSQMRECKQRLSELETEVAASASTPLACCFNAAAISALFLPILLGCYRCTFSSMPPDGGGHGAVEFLAEGVERASVRRRLDGPGPV